jgi:hypothetical protein
MKRRDATERNHSIEKKRPDSAKTIEPAEIILPDEEADAFDRATIEWILSLPPATEPGVA